MIEAIILAAGRSSRMGSLKLLLPFKGTTVIEHLINTILSSGVGSVSLVIGGVHEGVLRAALVGSKVRFQVNPDPDLGMLSSVRVGLLGLNEKDRGAMVFVGDQPELEASELRLLAASFRRTNQITIPINGGKRGHPIVIPRRFFPSVMSEFDDVGLRGLLMKHPEEITEVPVDRDAVLRDVDTPADYKALLDRMKTRL
jgi:molybdenum cofactor cytidylyltransferase